MGPITEICYNAIINECFEEETPLYSEDLLPTLYGETFRTYGSQLKYTMEQAGLCEKDSKNNVYVNKLTECINAQNKLLRKKPVDPRVIRRWLNAETHQGNREKAIELCFAMKLDYKLSCDFLNKIGFTSFNIRNVFDAICIYCIFHKDTHTLRDAYNMLERFENESDPVSISPETAEKKQLAENGTTAVMKQQLAFFANSDWENDERFFVTFLNPHREDFINP